jgi:H+-transporting ATPase
VDVIVEDTPAGHAASKGLTQEEPVHVNQGLTEAEAASLLQAHGRNEIVERTTPSWKIFLRGLYGPMPIAIWIAVIVEFSLQTWPDGGILLFILFANATISWYETMKAGNAVAALKKSLRPTATVCRDGKWRNIEGALLVPGDLVLLGAGSAVPADCVLHEGELEIDESALTGEAMPAVKHGGDKPLMGSNVVRGEAHATVEHTGMDTFFGRTASLLQSVGARLGGIQKLLVRVMIVLTGLSLVLCLTALLYLCLRVRTPFKEALEFTVVLIVASIPIAIEIVVTTTLAMGSRQLAHHKAIVTRLTAIESLASMNMLCSDKTGTLTLNEMQVQDDCPTYLPGHNKDTVMVLAALAAKWREPPRDALDRMVLGSADLAECDK